MPRPLPLTNTVADALHNHFGSEQAAVNFIDRDRMASRDPEQSHLTHRVITVSDLHIAAGRHPVTDRLDVIDDFKPNQEQQFVRLLAREWLQAAPGASLSSGSEDLVETVGRLPWRARAPISPADMAQLAENRAYDLTLNLNGDIFEFLQTTVERPGYRFVDGMDGPAPRNTPANAIVKLNIMHRGHPEFFRALAMHLMLGHRVHFLPGNHDRELWNPHVWDGQLEADGAVHRGFLGIMRRELAGLGCRPHQVDAALQRLERLPMAVYGDKLIDHGHREDTYNSTRRPHKELFDPTPLHEEMPLALGDYGVRDGFNLLERKRPYLGDAIGSKTAFVKEALGAPRAAFGMLGAFLKSALAEGHEVSAQADENIRNLDARGLVDAFPQLVDQLNAFRDDDDQLTASEVADGLEKVEASTAKPFFSAFKAGASFLQRLPGILKNQLSHQSKVAYERRLQALHEHLGINDVVHGHTHVAKDQHYLSDDGRRLRYVNSHTWLDQTGRWDRASRTWGDHSRGVGVIELGVNPDGRPWSELALMRVVDQTGSLVPGSIIDDAEGRAGPIRQRTKAILKGAMARSPALARDPPAVEPERPPSSPPSENREAPPAGVTRGDPRLGLRPVRPWSAPVSRRSRIATRERPARSPERPGA